MTAPTLSALGHVAACPGSARFPRQEEERGPEARLGSAIHAVNDAQVRGEWDADARGWGPCVGVEEVAGRFNLDGDDAGRLAFVARHMRLPVPAGALSEVSLGYFPDGSVRRIEGGAGHYPDVGQWLSGQLDLVWAEPQPIVTVMKPWTAANKTALCPAGSTLWICDVKTGDPENVPPPHANWQLRAGAVMAARWTGARRVKVAICFISSASISAALRAAREAREQADAARAEFLDACFHGEIDAGRRALAEMREHLAAAEAHEREAEQGRWEIGETLDGAALDAIEVEMRAVLARARGEQDEKTGADETGGCAGGDSIALAGQGGAEEGYARGGGSALECTHSRASSGAASLIIGAHCTHCHAAPVCPALSAFALTAARQTKADLETLDAATVAGLWAKVPALRRMADAIEVTARAWARKRGGTLRLPDGREYGPAVEERRNYDTAKTFDVLVPIVGEERANKAAKYTWASIERALKDAGAPPAAYAQVRKDLEAAGAVVVTSHEEWGYRQPAKPVEVDDVEALERRDRDVRGRVDRGCAEDAAGPVGGEPGGGGGMVRADGPGPDDDLHGRRPRGRDADDRSVDRGDPERGVSQFNGVLTPPVVARATCPTCKREVRVNSDGSLRAHKPCSRRWLTDPKVYPADAPPVEPARAEPPAAEAPRQTATDGA